MKSLILLSCLLVSTQADTSEIYWGTNETPGCSIKERSWLFNADVSCFNLTLTEGTVLKIENQTAPMDNISSVEIFYSTGSVDGTTLSFFPKVTTLNMRGGDIESFAPDNDLLEHLYVENSKFPKMDGLGTCKNLLTLGLSRNQMEIVSKGAFKDLKRLKKLTLNKQNIKHVTKEFFEGLSSLEVLKFWDSTVEEVDEDAFDELTRLTRLHFESDSLEKFERNTFKALKKLKDLKINGKKLDLITLDMLDQQKELGELGLPNGSWKNLDTSRIPKMFPKLFGFAYDAYKPDKEPELEAALNKMRNIIGFSS